MASKNGHNRKQRRRVQAAQRKARKQMTNGGASSSDEKLQAAGIKVESLQQQAQLANRIVGEAKALRKSLPWRHEYRKGLTQQIKETQATLVDIRSDAVLAADELLSILEERHRKLMDGEARVQIVQPNSPDAEQALREGRIVQP